jgi:hypothetical protein
MPSPGIGKASAHELLFVAGKCDYRHFHTALDQLRMSTLALLDLVGPVGEGFVSMPW